MGSFTAPCSVGEGAKVRQPGRGKIDAMKTRPQKCRCGWFVHTSGVYSWRWLADHTRGSAKGV